MAKFDSQTRVFPDYNESFEVYDRYTGGYVEPVGTYSLSSNVIFRISQQSGGPQDTSDNSHTVSYYEDSSPTDITVSSGGPYSVAGDTVATLSGRNQIRVNDASDLSFGNGTTNSPFTFSIWLKCDWSASSGGVSFPGNTLLYKLDEYWIYRELGGGSQNIHVRLYNSGGTIWSNARWSPSLADNEWINLTFTYDGQTDPDSLNLYVNGVPVDRDASSASADAMTAGTADLSVGSYGNNSFGDFVGEISDIFLFDTELTAADALTLYNARFGAISTLYQSGFLNNPPRTILQVRDNATGSYPTVSRIGDPGRTGRYNTNFNDTNSVVFNSNVTTSYPSDLQLADAAYISQSIATPNTNATIEATGIVRKGVADANITFTPGEDLTPFVEDNLFASTPEAFTDPFYLTGSTVADVGLGFTAPLRSKTKIEIDLNPVETTRFGPLFGAFASTDTEVPNANRQKMMVYYNHDLRRWEKIGIGPIYGSYSATTGLPAGFDSSAGMFMSQSMIGFSRSGAMRITGSNLRSSASPTNTFGFPYNARYHATSSQQLLMSSYIDAPFVAEKFVYEYSSSIKTETSDSTLQETGGNNTFSFASIDTFFILNQRKPQTLNITNSANWLYALSPPAVSINMGSQIPKFEYLTSASSGYDGLTWVDTTRDIVTWGQHTTCQFAEVQLTSLGTSGAELLSLGLARDVVEELDGSSGLLPSGLWGSGQYIMSGNMKIPGRTDVLPGSLIRSLGESTDAAGGTNRVISNVQNSQGSRSGITMRQSGRDLVGGPSGVGPVSGSLTFAGGGPTDIVSTTREVTVPNSPYILMPNDTLVFGWQKSVGYSWLQSPVGDDQVYRELAPGKGKLTIYGSLITDAHEHHDGLNQPLTSDAVHEFIGFHGPPLDQFDTEPRQQFSGSMLSSVITGSITTTEQPAVGLYTVSPTLRGVAGQRATGEWTGGQFTSMGSSPSTVHTITDANGVVRKPGSFDRSLLLSSENEVFYDSFPPDVFQVYQKLAIDPTYVNSGIWNIFVGSTPIAPDPGTPNWRGFFPFEPLVSDVPRAVTGDLSSNSGLDYQSVISYLGSTLGTARSIYANMESGVWLYDVEKGQVADNIKIFLYGTGDYKSAFNGTLNGGPSMWGAFAGIGPTAFGYGYVRGFKYGLYHANKRSTYCKFRSDKYGQFRDMLEQRMDTRFYSETSGRSTVSASPVQVRFVASDGTSESPSKTSSSNLSQFATSSLPYFDGVARNRGPIVTADLGLTIVSI